MQRLRIAACSGLLLANPATDADDHHDRDNDVYLYQTTTATSTGRGHESKRGIAMPDSIVRGLRTFVQGFIGILVLSAVPVLNGIVTDVVSGNGNRITVDLDIWRNIALAGIAGGTIALIAYVQNLFEDKSGKTLLK